MQSPWHGLRISVTPRESCEFRQYAHPPGLSDKGMYRTMLWGEINGYRVRFGGEMTHVLSPSGVEDHIR